MLMNETFVAVFPSLVRRLGGMNEAAVLQTIHFHLQIAHREAEGHSWTPLTCGEIGDRTGLSEDAVFRAVTALRRDDVLIGMQAESRSRKLMWRINYGVLEDPSLAHPSREVAESHTAISRSPSREVAESTTTKNTIKTVNNILPIATASGGQVVKHFCDEFKRLHNADPDKSSIGRLGRDAKRMLSEGRPLDLVIQAAGHCAAKGHANLPSALIALLSKTGQEPKGFAGIREFLEDGDPHG